MTATSPQEIPTGKQRVVSQLQIGSTPILYPSETESEHI